MEEEIMGIVKHRDFDHIIGRVSIADMRKHLSDEDFKRVDYLLCVARGGIMNAKSFQELKDLLAKVGARKMGYIL
jgi:hypothetical protein